MKKIHSQLMYKVIPCLGIFVLGACANIASDSGKAYDLASNSSKTGLTESLLKPPSLSSQLAAASTATVQAWKPLFVAASASDETKTVKVIQSQQPVQVVASVPVAARSASPLSPVSSAAFASVASAASSTVTASMIAPLKMDKSLDSLKYAIYFEYASANLNPTGKAALEYLQGDAKMADAIRVVGRADPSGDATKNVRLAQARANSVRSELAKYGVNVKNIKVNSYVALAKADDRVAYKQNLPADLSAASRRADVDMLVKPNVVSKLTVHSNFVAVPS